MWLWDIICKHKAYNSDNFVTYFQDIHTGFHIVYTHKRLGNSLSLMKRCFNEISNIYGYRAKFIYLDGELTLQTKFAALIAELGIRQKRSAPEAHQQPKTERAGRLLTIKARALLLGANLPDILWPEAYMAAAYIANRTPTKRLGWKTPFEAFTKSVPSIAHMHPFGCKAFPFIYHIPKLQKMAPRAHIGYLVGYDSTNIFRVWIPSRDQVIRTRDVTFSNNRFYDPSNIDICALRSTETMRLVETLDIPEVEKQNDDEDVEPEDSGYDSDTIVVNTTRSSELEEEDSNSQDPTTTIKHSGQLLTPNSSAPPSITSNSRNITPCSPSPDPKDRDNVFDSTLQAGFTPVQAI